MKRILEASDKCTREPYLTHNRSVNIRTLPLRDLIDLTSLTAQSVKYRFTAVSMKGVRLPLGDIRQFDPLRLSYACSTV